MKIAFFVAGVLFGWLLEWIVYLLFFKNRQQANSSAAAENVVTAPADEPAVETPAADESEPVVETDDADDEADAADEVVKEEAEPEEDAEEDIDPDDDDADEAGEDDLTLIKGIGPKLSESLAVVGVTTFAALEKLSEEELLAKFEASGVKLVNAAKIDTFAEQASLAAKGKWEDLKTLQKTL